MAFSTTLGSFVIEFIFGQNSVFRTLEKQVSSLRLLTTMLSARAALHGFLVPRGNCTVTGMVLIESGIRIRAASLVHGAAILIKECCIE